MKLLFIISGLIVLIGCNSAADKDTKKDNDKLTDFMKPQRLSQHELPAEVAVYGTFNDAWKWTDSLGENIFLLFHEVKKEAQGDEFDEEPESGFVHTVHYIKKDGKYAISRTSADDEKACSFDLLCDFIPGSTTITDLDNNGFAEIKFQYTKACRSDVSPASMTLVLREKGKNYILTGTRWVAFEDGMKFDITEENANLEGTPQVLNEASEVERMMGKYQSEYQFSDAPPAFLSYARKEWVKYAKENMGE